MNTMMATKIVGGVCGSLLVFLLVKWGADIIYGAYGGHKDHVAVYVIDGDAGGDAAAEAEAGPDFATLLANASPEAGERGFRACASCHSVEPGDHRAGPSMFGVVGRERGGVADFGAYSAALAGLGGEWTPEELSGFLENPRGYLPRTSMGYAGMRSATDRADMVAYLATLQ